MKLNSLDSENHNLVMFPSSKNYKVDLTAIEAGSDVIHDLINEYSHIKDSEIPSHMDDRFQEVLEDENFLLTFEDELDGDTFHSLEAFMNRNQRGDSMTHDDRLIKLINDRLQSIKEAKERIKYYLDEIDMFLPSRKK